MLIGLLIKVPSLLHKAALQGGEGQKCLIVATVLEAVCCVLSYILKLVVDIILGHLGPNIYCVQHVHGELKDAALMDNVELCSITNLFCWSLKKLPFHLAMTEL